MKYRADIDGLRGLAILPVVAFHAGLPPFSGGFVGVDLFFVISGFLITTIILEKREAGDFSLLSFYERRCRRILPAFFVVMVGTTVLSAHILFPARFEDFSRSLVSASLFLSSFQFSGEHGYFDVKSELKPLLHTWSLSVEEIFYLVYPVLIILFFRSSEKVGKRLLTFIALVSFLGTVFALARNPESKSAFFLPHSRAWELLLGALAAFCPPWLERGRRYAAPLSALGLALIAGSVFLYDEDTVFPGPAALVPCIGGFLIIHCGRYGSTFVSNLLSLPALVWVGRASFSLYLWHWPLLVLAKTYYSAALTAYQTAAVLGASAVLSAVTLVVVETPFRGSRGILSQKQIFLLSALSVSILAGIGAYGVTTDGWPGRFSTVELRIVNAGLDVDPRRTACLTSFDRRDGCLYGADGTEPTVALWGDSHAAMYAPALGAVAAERNHSAAVYTMPSCPPIHGWAIKNQGWRDDCLAFQEIAFQRILSSDTIRTVILGARFLGYPFQSPESGFDDGFRNTIERFLAAGKDVAIIYPNPEYGADVPETLYRLWIEDGLPTELKIERQVFAHITEEQRDYLDGLSYPMARLYPEDHMCDAEFCYFFRNGAVYSHDVHHLSLSGVMAMREMFEKALDGRE